MKARVAVVVGGSALVAIAACSTSEPNGTCPNSGSAATVTITNAGFSPASVTISVGQSVCWQNNTGVAHTATSDDSTSFSGVIGVNGTYTHTFGVAGFFPYHCTVLGHNETGLVTVEGQLPPGQPSPRSQTVKSQ
jgi:plastocyanin